MDPGDSGSIPAQSCPLHVEQGTIGTGDLHEKKERVEGLKEQGKETRGVRMNTVVCQVSILQQLSVSTGSVRKVPLMDNLAVDVNKVDSTGAGEVGEERVPRRHVMRVEPSQT